MFYFLLVQDCNDIVTDMQLPPTFYKGDREKLITDCLVIELHSQLVQDNTESPYFYINSPIFDKERAEDVSTRDI